MDKRSPEAIRKANQRQRDEDAGMKQINVKVHKSNVETLREFALTLQEPRKGKKPANKC